MEILGQGAEAVLKLKNNVLVKERIKKGYRLKEIDALLRKDRTKKEAKLLSEARRNKVNTPVIFSKDPEKMTIEMEFIKGPVLRDKLDSLPEKERKKVCSELGSAVARLHSAGIIHGDLTTSNMILKNSKTDQLYFIDFGLAFSSKKIEDKAVDMHLIKRALVSKHNKIWKKCFNSIVSAYKKHSKDSDSVIQRMEKIEKRGRYSR